MPRRARDARAVTSDGHVRLTIELDHGGPAPAGRLRDAGGDSVTFDGWLQLLGALRAAIPAGVPSGHEPSAPLHIPRASEEEYR